MHIKFWTLSFLLLRATVSMADSTVLVETEHFDRLGGWVVDQQFMDEMGSPSYSRMVWGFC